ncbi:MAG: sulfotransferase [Planctomycetota bacterium]
MKSRNTPGVDQQSATPRPAPRGRVVHPLCGADLPTLLHLTTRAKGVDAGGWLRLAIAWSAAVARAPVLAAEAFTVGRGAPHGALRVPPVFIVGHWRSGTTHLYNVISRSPAFATVSPLATGLPWDFVLLQRLFGPLLRRTLPKNRFIDRIPVHADSPQEDENGIAHMQPLSYYHGLYFPERLDRELDRGIFLDGVTERETERWRRAVRRFLVKLDRTHPGRTVVIKNPVYAARVGELAKMFPGAKFIHIHRDPRRVYPSMQNFYHVLLRQLGLGPADHVDVDETVLRVYPRMMERLYNDLEAIPDGNKIDIRFDAFEEDPIGVIGRLHSELSLPGFDDGREAMERYLASVTSYKKNTYPPDPELEALLMNRWGVWMRRLGYASVAGSVSASM